MRLLYLLAAVFAALLYFCDTALAQALREERELLQLPVSERVPEDFKKPPIRRGGFFIRPSVSFETRYDSNIFAASKDEQEDLVLSVRPGVSVLKLFNAHTFIAGANGNIERYASESSENREEFNGFIRGRLDLGGGGSGRWSAPFGLSYGRRVKDRTTPQSQDFTTEPLAVSAGRAEIGIAREFGRFSLTLLGNYSRVRLEDGISARDGARVVFSDSDRDTVGANIRLRYGFPRGQLSDGFEHILFLNYTIEQQDFLRRSFAGGSFSGFSEDNLRQGLLAGFETDYKGLIFANIGAGFFRQDYDDPGLDATTSLDLSADIAWNVTPKLTLSFEAERDSEQNNDFLQGFVRTDYLAGLDYELLHDWYMRAELGYTEFDFSDSFNIQDPEQEDYIAGLSLRHLIGRGLESSAEIRYLTRDANTRENEFDRAVLLLRLSGRL